MTFILGVLIIGALLAVIFGRRVGAMFVTGIGSLVIAGVGVVSLLFLWFVLANGFSSSSPASTSSTYPSYGATPVYGSSTPSQTYASSRRHRQLTRRQRPQQGTGPRLGVDIVDNPANGMQFLAYLHPPADAGAWIRVHPHSPAEEAGLRSYDVILSAGTQSEQANWITPSHQLPDYLDRVGYNVPVSLHIYRATEQRDFWVWVNPR